MAGPLPRDPQIAASARPAESRPTVAIVGRPNVGKSTLFNRLVGRRQAIVHDQPGVTRDRITGLAELGPDRSIHLIDTGGLVPGDDPLGLNRQVLAAVDESDLVVLVMDGRDGLTSADERVWQELRGRGKPALLVVNKADIRASEESFPEFYRTGLEPLAISAEHGVGIAELRRRLADRLPPQAAPTEAPAAPTVAIVGRPNVGKSSLLNRIVGGARSLVSEEAGTTRDPVDTLIERDGRRYLLVDTAGIRRRSRQRDAPEELAVMMAARQLERADAAVLVVDAGEGITAGDLAIAGRAWEQGRCIVVALNKWDLVDRDALQRLDWEWPRLVDLAAAPPAVQLSALSGEGVEELFPALERTLAAWRAELATGELNRLLEAATERHQPPVERGSQWKLYYATQVATGPPTFMLFANRPLPISSPYRRYLENRLREQLQAPGVPIRLVIRKRDGR